MLGKIEDTIKFINPDSRLELIDSGEGDYSVWCIREDTRYFIARFWQYHMATFFVEWFNNRNDILRKLRADSMESCRKCEPVPLRQHREYLDYNSNIYQESMNSAALSLSLTGIISDEEYRSFLVCGINAPPGYFAMMGILNDNPVVSYCKIPELGEI